MVLNINSLSVPNPNQGSFPLMDFTLIFPNKQGKHGSIFLRQLPFEFKEILASQLEELWKMMFRGPTFHC